MKPHILIADDEDAMCRLLGDILGNLYCLTIVRTGREVYQLLTTCRDLYALAIVDVVMPEWNGHASVELATGLGSEVPVLYVTGLSEYDTRHIPPGQLLSKPFTAKELVLRVGGMLRTKADRGEDLE